MNSAFLLKNNKVFMNEHLQNLLMYRYYRMAFNNGNELAAINLGTFHLYGYSFKKIM